MLSIFSKTRPALRWIPLLALALLVAAADVSAKGKGGDKGKGKEKRGGAPSRGGGNKNDHRKRAEEKEREKRHKADEARRRDEEKRREAERKARERGRSEENKSHGRGKSDTRGGTWKADAERPSGLDGKSPRGLESGGIIPPGWSTWAGDRKSEWTSAFEKARNSLRKSGAANKDPSGRTASQAEAALQRLSGEGIEPEKSAEIVEAAMAEGIEGSQLDRLVGAAGRLYRDSKGSGGPATNGATRSARGFDRSDLSLEGIGKVLLDKVEQLILNEPGSPPPSAPSSVPVTAPPADAKPAGPPMIMPERKPVLGERPGRIR